MVVTPSIKYSATFVILPIEKDPRWATMQARKQSGSFVYAVKTTGVYNRSDCCSPIPKPKNVIFFDSAPLAEAQGYRPCLRCRPRGMSVRQEHIATIHAACTMLQMTDVAPSLKELAEQSGMSVFHFHRIFKSVLGITPKAFIKANRMEKFRENLGLGDLSVTAAMYDAGFRSSSRLYATATGALGMTPSRFKAGGSGVKIMFAVGECSLGSILVACSDRGICAILFADTPERVLLDFQARFSGADLIGKDLAYEVLIAQVIAFVDAPKIGLDLPLDLKEHHFKNGSGKRCVKFP